MPCSVPHQYLIQFFSAVRDFYRTNQNERLDLLNDMSALLDQLISNSFVNNPGLEHKLLLPAVVHLASAVESAGTQTKALAQSINQLAPFLNWQQTKGYEVLGEAHLENYGYCSIIGPGLLIENSGLKLGFGIWGPNLHYPLHHHAAEECYHVIGHSMQMRREGEQWQSYRDSDAIYNPSRVKHELKSNEDPMLLLYTWRGKVGEDAILD